MIIPTKKKNKQLINLLNSQKMKVKLNCEPVCQGKERRLKIYEQVQLNEIASPTNVKIP